MQDSYDQKPGKSKKDARNHLSLLFLLGNLISMVSCLAIGFLSDRIKIYKLMNLLNVVMTALLGMIVYDIANDELQDLGLFFDIGFTLA